MYSKVRSMRFTAYIKPLNKLRGHPLGINLITPMCWLGGSKFAHTLPKFFKNKDKHVVIIFGSLIILFWGELGRFPVYSVPRVSAWVGTLVSTSALAAAVAARALSFTTW